MVLQFHFTFKPFPSHAQKRERARERKSSDAQRERKKRNREPRNRLRLRRTHLIALRRIEKTHSSNPFNHTQKTHSIKPRKPIRQTQKTHSIAPSQTLIALIAPSARSSHPSTDPPKTDHSRRTPKPIVLVLFLLGIENLGFVSFGFWWTWVLINLTGFDEFFLLGFVSFVFIYWEMILIFVWKMRKCEKHDKNGFSRAFSRIQPNTRKYFPKYFLECNQTLENIFLSGKYFTGTKHSLREKKREK